MDLMKELLTPQGLDEANYHDFSDAKYTRFKKIMNIVDKELDHLYVLAKEGSGFSKLVNELGGDPGILIEARQHLKKLDDVMSDLEMTVGMAQEKHDEDNG
jgi:hypothetical protein